MEKERGRGRGGRRPRFVSSRFFFSCHLHDEGVEKGAGTGVEGGGKTLVDFCSVRS